MLSNNRIIISPLERKDLESLRLLRNDFRTSYYLTSVVPINEVNQDNWFTAVSHDNSKMYYSIYNHQRQFVGVIRTDEWDKINRSIRVGIDIIPELRRRGYAKSSYNILLRYLFHQLSIHRVWLAVADYNEPGKKLYKQLGFIEEGKMRDAIFRNNTYHDYIIMSLLAQEYSYET